MPSSSRARGLSFPFAKEEGFLPAVTVLHTFGSDLKRHVHIHFIVSSGDLKLSGKAERFTRYVKRKAKNRRARKKKAAVLVDEPSWVRWAFFPHKMLRKRYRSLLIKDLKERIRKEPSSDTPDPDLMVFSEPSAMKGFFDDLNPTIGYIGRYARRPPYVRD